MSFPGLLIEDLIAGGLALMWIVHLPLPVPIRLDYSNLALVGIAAYTLGMLVDFAAYTILLRPKRWLRGITARRLGISYRPIPAGTASRNVKFMLYAPEITKAVEVRSSRDRDCTRRGAQRVVRVRRVVPRGVVVCRSGGHGSLPGHVGFLRDEQLCLRVARNRRWTPRSRPGSLRFGTVRKRSASGQ